MTSFLNYPDESCAAFRHLITNAPFNHKWLKLSIHANLSAI
ncbi:hypothetical protein AO366_0627 [Moraxella catarrhalis]|uniref:Uncharacterized protein n=1 Tax=Moraxella catarrhalis TaxID=480 RepID=A0A198X9S2_MORCA|nr:hypothetical protein AO380_1675 [Moraxella catarrhalis]OAV04451.1 hypothetical protein AO381_0739 [Moraxella catarrhalis]OAV07063.1 hypothetical protein AO379_0216 [Moraxella catarrhalis]OAV10862.1 hypothetical protein AO377_0660 [Moraxella catarrhalis]OAV12001.1 hypothetical protein AO378_0036 [Moraxella catarrhalis]